MFPSGVFDLPWWGYLLAVLVMTHVTIAAVTIYLHRHQAHRALDLGPLPSHFFRFWLWLTTGMVTKEWAAIHRKHHAKCETVDDPHSPQVLGLNRVLWGGVFLYVKESRLAETMERYGHGTPDDWLERHIYTPGQKLGIVLMLAIDLALFGLVPGALIWGVQMIWIPFWAAGVINGVGHFWGYRNFACSDASTNIVPWGILIGGEELHNNHHAYPGSARLSSQPWEFDIGWFYIRLLERMGLARVKKVAPSPARLLPTAAGPDPDTLRTIAVHRMQVLARYSRKVIKAAYRAEVRRLGGADPELRQARALLLREESLNDGSARRRLQQVLARSEALATVYRFRERLQAIWQGAAEGQALAALEQWRREAEASGVAALQEFARRIGGWRSAAG